MADDADDLKKRAAEIGEAVSKADDQRAADTQLGDTLTKLCGTMQAMAERLDKLETAKQAGSDDQVDTEPAFVRDDRNDVAYRTAMARAQMMADEVAHSRGQRAPAPLSGEDLMGYRRRLLRDYRADCKDFKDVDLHSISGAAFDAVEKRIYADAKAAADRPFVPAGQLVPRISQDGSGRQIITYFGEPRAWMDQFSGYRGSVKAFRPPGE